MAKKYSYENIVYLNSSLAHLAVEEVIIWAASEFGTKLSFASSFGAEDMVVLDLLMKIASDAEVFLLDTGRLHQETYDLIEKANQHYSRSFTVYVPQTEALQQLLNEHGPNSFYNSIDARKACCHVRKVEPLSRALSGVDAWITGQRRQQSLTRTSLLLVEIDDAHGGILKINPLAEWSEEQVWAYIRENGLPYNALHDKGFPSIGCQPCTRAILTGEDARAGRWWWEEPEHKECGLHLNGSGI